MRATLPFRCLTWSLAAALLLSPAALPHAQVMPAPARSLPSLGDASEMSVSEERRLGDRIARDIYRDPDYLDDPALTDYLQALWQPLIAAARARGDVPPDLAERFAWELMVARDRTVNAFALPGGYLGVHLGLIGTVSNASELASVLAHELSHVSQRHIARLIGRQDRQAPWVIGAMILGALAASAAQNADIANAAIMGSQAAAAQSQLNFSRDMEREADRVGFGVMTEAGFDGLGFVTMFDKLQQASRLNDDGAFPYLRSHPLTTERMADMRTRVPHDSHTPGPAGGTAVGPTYHAMMSARARVLAETQIDRLRAQASLPLNGPQRDATTAGARYAAVLAAAQLRDTRLAATQLERLLASQPGDADALHAIRLLALEAMLLTGSSELAGLRLDELRQQMLTEKRRGAVLMGARAALADHTPATLQAAVERLQTWTALHGRDALAWQTLSSLYQAQQRPARAARAEAEARLAHLDAPGALDRLKAAQALARRSPTSDHFEQSILDARVRQVEQIVREQIREEREAGE